MALESSSEFWIQLAVSSTFLALGVLLTVNEQVAVWGLSRGRARIWVKLLGMQRAVKVTRYFFGPVVALLGAVVLVGGLTQRFGG